MTVNKMPTSSTPTRATKYVLTKATELIEDGYRKILCGYCGWKWIPRKVVPKQCPNCKRGISASEEMIVILRKKIMARLPEVEDVREVVPDFFTPQCSECGEEASGRYKGKFLCANCLIDAIKGDGVVQG